MTGGLRKKPDLRSPGHLMKCTRGVRIEFEIDDHEVLFSDFMDWHCVLNSCLCSDNEEELDSHYEELEREGLSRTRYKDLPPRHKERIERSWESIFDLDSTGLRENKAIQATFWELRLGMVRDVQEFTSR
jgi:hypothetical protein